MSGQPLRRRWSSSSRRPETTTPPPTGARGRPYSSARRCATRGRTEAIRGGAYDADKSATEEDGGQSVRSAEMAVVPSLGLEENTCLARTTTSLEHASSPSQGTATPPKDDQPNAATRPPLDVTQFQVVYLLGRGAFGQVHMAWHPSLRSGKSFVAVKSVSKVTSRGFRLSEVVVYRELTILQSLLGTDFFCQLLCAFHSRRMVYFVMEFARFGSMLRHVHREGRLIQSEAVIYFAEITHAISVLHERNISHGDVKPANILIRRDGHIVLTDFGCANQFTGYNKSKHRLQTPRGTPGYMAPEMYLTRDPYDPYAADWYSAGATLFTMVTGRDPCKRPVHPRHQGNVRKLAAFEDELLSLMCTHPDVFSVVNRLMAARPKARLCCRYGVSELKHERLFKDVRWDDVAARRLKMPSIKVSLEKVALARETVILDRDGSATRFHSDRFKNFSYYSPRLLELLDTKTSSSGQSEDLGKGGDWQPVSLVISDVMAAKMSEEVTERSRSRSRPRQRVASSEESQSQAYCCCSSCVIM